MSVPFHERKNLVPLWIDQLDATRRNNTVLAMLETSPLTIGEALDDSEFRGIGGRYLNKSQQDTVRNIGESLEYADAIAQAIELTYEAIGNDLEATSRSLAKIIPLYSHPEDNPTRAPHWTQAPDDGRDHLVAFPLRDLETYKASLPETEQ